MFFQKLLISSWISILFPSKQSPPDIIYDFMILFSSSFDAVFIYSIVAKRRPFMGHFSFGNTKKSQGTRSGEYDGCAITSVLFFAKNSRLSNDVWAGALSWCKSQCLFFHIYVRLWRITSRNLRITCRQYSLLTVLSCGKNAWCTTPMQSKKTVSKTFTFDRSWCKIP